MDLSEPLTPTDGVEDEAGVTVAVDDKDGVAIGDVFATTAPGASTQPGGHFEEVVLCGVTPGEIPAEPPAETPAELAAEPPPNSGKVPGEVAVGSS